MSSARASVRRLSRQRATREQVCSPPERYAQGARTSASGACASSAAPASRAADTDHVQRSGRPAIDLRAEQRQQDSSKGSHTAPHKAAPHTHAGAGRGQPRIAATADDGEREGDRERERLWRPRMREPNEDGSDIRTRYSWRGHDSCTFLFCEHQQAVVLGARLRIKVTYSCCTRNNDRKKRKKKDKKKVFKKNENNHNKKKTTTNHQTPVVGDGPTHARCARCKKSDPPPLQSLTNTHLKKKEHMYGARGVREV